MKEIEIDSIINELGISREKFEQWVQKNIENNPAPLPNSCTTF